MRYVTRSSLLFLLILLMTGCTQEHKAANHLDGKVLLEVKCAACHNLDMPPVTTPDEPAPPIMAVAFHVYDFVKVSTPAERHSKAVAFVKDYVVSPSKEKSFCDAKSLEQYGVMPSQKGKVSIEELEAIASYMFDHYNQENYLKVMKERQALREMAPGERIVRKYGCISCHGVKTKKMGPSFQAIARRYSDEKEIRRGIQEGSYERWPEARHAKMPPFRQLTEEELMIISRWIMEKR